MFFWKTADSYWLTRAQAFRWMQFSVVTWRQPLDEEVAGEEGLVDDLVQVSNDMSLIVMGNSADILHFTR